MIGPIARVIVTVAKPDVGVGFQAVRNYVAGEVEKGAKKVAGRIAS